MLDRSKVIKGLPCLTGVPIYCETCPYSDEFGFGYGNRRCAKECASDALALLKEQEPKPVGKEWNECPSCGKVLDRIHDMHYCGVCGQAVKWDA